MDPFIGEIRAFAFTFAPMGWASCEGQIMQIQQNTALFSILGTYFGGDGKTTFGLPNLQGRAPMDVGAGPQLTPRNLGQVVGGTTVPLTMNNFPPHIHALNVVSNANADKSAAANNYLSKGGNPGRVFVATNSYLPQPSAGTQLATDAVQPIGTAQPTHDNMQPYLPVMLCIAVTGIYPVRP